MHISSNEVSTKNQLTMGRVTHKLIYMLKPFNFINVGQHPLSYSLNFVNVEQYSLSYSNIFKNYLKQKLKLMVEGSRIGL